MYAPVEEQDKRAYSIVTDGPYDPDDPSYPPEWRPRRGAKEYFLRQRQLFTDAALVFTLSSWARDKVLRLHNADPARVLRIGWGPMLNAVEPTFVITGKDPYFVSVGNEWRRKGMDIVAAAGAELHRLHPNLKTIIAGDPAGLRIAPSAGIELIPRKIGKEQLRCLLSGARGLVLASRFDASPLIIMEALMCGTPVIASGVCGIPEVVPDGIAGRIVPAGDVDSLCRAMESLLMEDTEAQRRRAWEHFQNLGGWQRSAQIILDAFGAAGVR